MSYIIGIIGGGGIAATNKLLEIIEEKITMAGAYRDVHHPEMIIYQATKAPSRSMYIEGRGESFVEDYINVANKLHSIGAEKLCMNCNTAHYAIEEISKKTNLPFINLIEEVALTVKNRNIQSVGLMVTDGSRLCQLYDKYFTKICPNIKIIYPSEEMQKKVTEGICNIKNINRFCDDSSSSRPKNIFSNISEYLRNEGAEIVISGCTDIRVDYKSKYQNDIDSLEVLAEAIIRESDYKN